jgi:DNA (cytosine-5)-methyltransferase 1
MLRPLMVDLYCKAGGAAMGYHRAGFDVVGVDIEPQPNYPFDFLQGDALEVLARLLSKPRYGVAAIHASPPCHDHSAATKRWQRAPHGTGALLAWTREALQDSGLPWTIENVPGAPMRADFTLCGCHFRLPGLRRKRLFETSWSSPVAPPKCVHIDRTITVAGHPGGSSKRDGTAGRGSTADWKLAMGIDWMTAVELAQAIPPAYTQYLGAQMFAAITQEAAA